MGRLEVNFIDNYTMCRFAGMVALTLAGTGGGGVMQPPAVFQEYLFVYRSNVTNFSIAYQPSFLRPLQGEEG